MLELGCWRRGVGGGVLDTRNTPHAVLLFKSTDPPPPPPLPSGNDTYSCVHTEPSVVSARPLSVPSWATQIHRPLVRPPPPWSTGSEHICFAHTHVLHAHVLPPMLIGPAMPFASIRTHPPKQLRQVQADMAAPGQSHSRAPWESTMWNKWDKKM